MRLFYTRLIVVLILMAPTATKAQVQVSGLIDFVARNAKEPDITNVTFRNESTLNTMRARLFFDAPLNGNSAAFVQVTMDNYQINLFAAYVRFANLLGPHVNVNVGLIPNTVGNFGPRTYSDKNPLIGVPLLWVHHSSYVPGAAAPPTTVDELVALKTERSRFGLPTLYDNCWNTGIEVYGASGPIDYSIALLSGAVSKPSITQAKEIPQATARLAWVFGPELIVGVNGFAGPYAADDAFAVPLPDGKSAEDYLNYGGGYDLAFSRGYLEIYSEVFRAVWQTPFLPDLKATSGYIDAKYKVAPGWYVAGRFGAFVPDKITVASKEEVRWDSQVLRYEFGLGYHPSRNTTIKAVTQLNRFEDAASLNTDHFAMQLSVLL